MGKGRPLERRHEPAVDRQPDRDVGQGERGAGDMAAGARELAVEDRHHARPLLLRGLDLARVMEGRVFTHDRREGVAPGAVELRRLPVDPAVDLGARLRFGRQQRFGRPFVGEIADDAVALPQHEVAVDDHRHQAVGVLLELRAVVGARVGDADLLAGPQDLAHVDRRGLAEDAYHRNDNPPLSATVWPVMYSVPISIITTCAHSSGVPKRPSGMRDGRRGDRCPPCRSGSATAPPRSP